MPMRYAGEASCDTPFDTRELTGPQAAAAARLLYAAEQPGSIAVLCGPAGVGKTSILRHVAGAAEAALRTVRLCTLADLVPRAASRTDGDWGRPEVAPDLLLVDGADQGTAADLVAAVARCRGQHARTAIVLAGEGRLLSLLAADARLERAVRLRAVVPTFTLAETRRLLGERLTASRGADVDGAIRTIHEIAAGAPAAALRLAEIAALVAAEAPGRGLGPDTIESIHRRICLTAA